MSKYEWNYPGNNPAWNKNFTCKLSNEGTWIIESQKSQKSIKGKWIFEIHPLPNRPPAPTFADQNNFMSGLIEAEWRNDLFKFDSGLTRCTAYGHPETWFFQKRLNLFQDVLNNYKFKYNGQVRLQDDGGV